MTGTYDLGIDIEPGSSSNIIRRREEVRVALLSSDTLDVTTGVDPDSLTFGVTGSEPSWLSCEPDPVDVNADGLPDLICLFDAAEAGFERGDKEGRLLVVTWYGVRLLGRDAVRVAGPPPRLRSSGARKSIADESKRPGQNPDRTNRH
jgi:hypothetical protein